MKNQVGVAALGDVLDVNTWSNTPYHFFKAGEKMGVFSLPWRLHLDELRWKRLRWNLFRVLSGKGMGGFQFSPSFLNECEKQVPQEYFQSTVISFNQVFPRARKVKERGGRVFYYIDSTLHDLFKRSSYGINISRSAMEQALAIEKENYQRADAVVTMGTWVIPSVINDYQVDPRKVFHILPGANISVTSNFALKSLPIGAGVDRELVLGFVGKDWRRKGLQRLVNVVDLLNERGVKCKILVIGAKPDEFAATDKVEFTGFVDKRIDERKFITSVLRCDLGCLFSDSEALGISILEFLRLGIPVAGFYHEGLKDTLKEGASIRFDLTVSNDNIASVLANTVLGGQLVNLADHARSIAPSVTWENTVLKWKELL